MIEQKDGQNILQLAIQLNAPANW